MKYLRWQATRGGLESFVHCRASDNNPAAGAANRFAHWSRIGADGRTKAKEQSAGASECPTMQS
jgi:hypothetical protein